MSAAIFVASTAFRVRMRTSGETTWAKSPKQSWALGFEPSLRGEQILGKALCISGKALCIRESGSTSRHQKSFSSLTADVGIVGSRVIELVADNLPNSHR